MIDRTKTFKRLGIVGAAAAVGLVPLSVLATPAFAVTPGSASLSITPTTPSSPSTATDAFTTDSALPAGGTIIIGSTSTAGGNTPTTAVQLPAAAANYTVSVGGTADPVTAVTGSPTAANITVQNAIASGASVTVTIASATNPTLPSTVYFTDTTSSDTHAAVNTNTVSIGNATVVTPSVKQVNPTAFRSGLAGSQPFTVIGTNFAPGTGLTGTGGNAPVICFVAAGTTAPTPGATPGTTCPGAAGTVNGSPVTASAPATLTFASAAELQALSPNLTANGPAAKSYNIVVYNFNPNSTPAGYTAASPTSSTTLVGVSTGLNVIPESGVRVADTRTGTALPKGTLPTGTPVALALSAFNNTPTVPTNVPITAPAAPPTVPVANGLALNVTAVAPASGGNIQIWTANGACTAANNPGTATVNFQQPQDTNNAQFIPFAAGATNMCIQDNGAAVNLVIDVVGYTTGTGFAAPAGGAPLRLLDTRTGTAAAGGTALLGPLSGNTVYSFTAPPALDGQTVALNVADVAPTTPGNLRVFPEPASGPPAASAVPNAAVDNYIVNTDGSAMLITQVPANGKMDIYSDTGSVVGKVNVVIDELGVFPAGTHVTALSQPVRIYDSRPGPIAAGSTVTVVGSPTGSGSNFVPAGALGLVGNLSDINPKGQGYIVTFPAGGALPGTASEANFPLQTRNTNNTVALNPSNGSFSIYAGGAATNTTFDASGYIS